MANTELNNIFEHSDYKFLNKFKENGNQIALLTYGGSYSYGTNVEGSDIDIRGIFLPSKEQILSMNYDKNPYTDTETDTVLYPLKQIITLLCSANPNTIEILGTRDEDIFVLSEEGKMLKENTDLFLTRTKVYSSFQGYAQNQLRRLKNAIARDELKQAEKEKHILESVQKRMNTFEESYQPITDGKLHLHIEDSLKKDLDKEIMIDINLNNYPLRDTKKMLDEMSETLRQYNKIKQRSQKDEPHLLKHSMHLVRLYLMGIDILKGNGIQTYRSKERNLLLDIRNGKYTYEEVYEMAYDLDVEFKNLVDQSPLPDKLDYDKINELVMEINKKTLSK